MTIAAMQAGDETASIDDSRARLVENLNEPLIPATVGGRDDVELMRAIGLA